MMKVREAEGRPGRRADQASQTSATSPVATATGNRYKWLLVIVTSSPLIVKTRVSDPNRSLNPLLRRRPVPASSAAWIRIADTPRFWATHSGTAAGIWLGSVADQGSIRG